MKNLRYIRPIIGLRLIEKNFEYLYITKKKKKELFMILFGSNEAFSSCSVFSMLKSLN